MTIILSLIIATWLIIMTIVHESYFMFWFYIPAFVGLAWQAISYYKRKKK
jgi:hypothetical protein